jgi:ankyrin repeat protein
MFPNPQDAFPLPPRPSFERYKKLAKELAKACKSGRAEAIPKWSEVWLEALAKLSGAKSTRDVSVRVQRWIDEIAEFATRKMQSREPAARNCALADAQFVIARSHGFASWPKFSKHLEASYAKSSNVARFETAADAIVGGDVRTLARLLREDPKLVRTTSTREHGATLLHYVSANGVENYRQRTPKNIVKITQMLLNAGAEVDAVADVYGGGCTTLGLAATSAHPRKAGVQNALLKALVDHGAQLEVRDIGGNRQSAVMACLANGCPEAALYLADRGARLELEGAAGVGRVEAVKKFFDDGGKAKAGASRDQINSAFRYACLYGQTEAAEFLLDHGAEIGSQDRDGQTGLHYAVVGGKLETIQMLSKHNPPLEAQNMYGGTVLGQAAWSAAHGGDTENYIAILEALIAAGAKLPERHVVVNARVDAWLAKHGSIVEPSWYWYGEKPRTRR